MKSPELPYPSSITWSLSQIWLLRFNYHLSGKLKTLNVFWGLQKECLFGWLGCWTWLERTITTPTYYYGDILCLVAGQYGDISQDFHDLLKKLASTKAQHISLLEGRPVSDSEQGLILHHLRRRLSVSIITAQSRCLLTRLNHMAPAAKEAAKKRAFSKHWQQIEENDRLYHF